MAMDELYPLPEHDGPKIGQEGEVVWERRGRCDSREGNVVDLQARQQPSYTNAVRRMTVRDDDHLD